MLQWAWRDGNRAVESGNGHHTLRSAVPAIELKQHVFGRAHTTATFLAYRDSLLPLTSRFLYRTASPSNPD
jgi:hypothetical protein